MNIEKFKAIIGEWSLSVSDIALEAGQVTLIYGPSGSGKTSFFQGLLGLSKANYDLVIDDVNISSLPPLKRQMSIVFQYNNLFNHLTVLKNLELIKSSVVEFSRFIENIKKYNIENLLDKKASILSGGEQQMVSCVRAFMHHGRRVLLLDEPWSSMDFENKSIFRNHLLDFLYYEKIPCILISHDKDEEISYLNPRYIYDFTQVARFEKGQPED